jgi:8-oxo-dGTP pyrophosphatase MutT (NUDIX family)
MASKRKPIKRGRQCAALPYQERNGETHVLLVTSRETKRWVLPKGWTEKRGQGAKQAAQEAFEEAGIVGRIGSRPIGAEVFALAVEQLLDEWPEKSQRERRWFTLPEAAMAVEEGGLVTLMLRLAAPTS